MKVSQKRWLLSRILGRKKGMNKLSEARETQRLCEWELFKVISGSFECNTDKVDAFFLLIKLFYSKIFGAADGSIKRYSLSGK